ncbi:MAG TPA: tetratricopeptide repeat protein, partial [Verrucomicrobiae bacterium]
EEALKISPTEAELHYKLALGLNEIGETGRVLSELELAVKYNPRHARAWYNLGLARSGRGDLPGALEALARAESVDSSNPRIPYARATVLARLQRYSEARRATRRALELDPNFSDAAQLLRQLEGR